MSRPHILAAALLTVVLLPSASATASGPPPTAPAPVASLGVASAAAAAPDQVVSNKYSSYRMAWVGKFNFCLGIWVHGTMRADMYFTSIEGGAQATMTNPRVVNPKLLVTVKKRCDDGAAVKRYHQANVLNYRNLFYGYKCSYDPSFSVSFPWSIGVGITPDCGQERVAKYGATNRNARRAYRFSLNTDGYAFKWKQSKTNTQPTNHTMCSSVSTYFVIQDTQGAVRKKVLKKVGASDACVYYKHPF